MIKALVFDLDDTLYSEFEYIKSGYRAIDNWIKEEFKVNGFYKKAIDLFYLGERKFVFNKTLEHLNIEYDKQLINKLVDKYRAHYPDIHLLDDAKWVFDHLNKSIKIGLISDGFIQSQANKVKALRISERFGSIILTDWYGREYWKPSPFPYELIKSNLMCEHHECAYVGDNPQKDFITANKLGWTTIQIIRKEGIYSKQIYDPLYIADYQISDLRELLYLDELKPIFQRKKGRN